MRVLITDGNERAALAVTRALGHEKVEVVVGAESRTSLAGQSRYCTRSFEYPSPYEHPDGFLSKVLSMVREYSPDALYPISEMAMELIGRNRNEFEQHTVLPVPPVEVFDRMSDKVGLMQLAQRLQVPIPPTIFVKGGEIDRVMEEIKEFPVVVKPARSLVQFDGRWYKSSVHVVASKEELRRLYGEKAYLQGPSLIQDRIVGEGQGVFGLMNRGQPVALFAHRRLRERPPSGGVSVLRESVALPQPMTEYAFRLLQQAGWHGVAMVEYKINQRTGVPLLMEINGRFWGSLQLALDADLNFPYLLLQVAKGQLPSGPCHSYKAGIRSRWFLGDLDQLLLRLFKSDEVRRLPPGSASRLASFVEFCQLYQRNTYYEIERLEDPRPALYEYRRYFLNLLGAQA